MRTRAPNSSGRWGGRRRMSGLVWFAGQTETGSARQNGTDHGRLTGTWSASWRGNSGEGAAIAICARDAAELEAARRGLSDCGVQALTFVCDITDPLQVQTMLDKATRQLGSIDVLVNNAGLIQVGPLSEMTIEDFQRAMNVIFWGTLYTTLAVLPAMRERRTGSIVNVTSIGGKASGPHLLPYSCAKFAAVALSEGLRSELAPEGIRVTTIVPGLMRTGSHLHAEFKGKYAQEYAWFSAGAGSALISISAERAARSIVRATVCGDAEKILSIPAELLSGLHAGFPELTAGVLTVVSRLLPSAEAHSPAQSRTGAEVHAKLNSRLWEAVIRPGQEAASL